MSEKKSWDIQPKRKAPPLPSAPQPVRQDRRIPIPVARPLNRPRPSPKPQRRQRVVQESVSGTIIRREKVKQGREREPLKERRKRARRRTSLVLLILLLILVGGVFAGLWSSAFRIQHVEAAGPDSDGIQTAAMVSLAGTYEYVLPRNSIFFFPQSSLRAQILAEYPDVSAISISRVSFNTIAINSVPREPAFLWCGAAYTPTELSTAPIVSIVATSSSVATLPTLPVSLPSAPIPCYDTDAQGDVYALDNGAPSDTLRIYDSLASTSIASTSPLGEDISEANMIPNALQFVKVIKGLGVSVVALVIRGDEADLYAQSGTRVTYVLGTEEATAHVAESAFPDLNLNDGSLDYVDLRFAGKLYFKKTGSSNTGTSATSTYSSSVSCYLSGNCKIQ